MQAGSVSWGTMRWQDVGDQMLDALEYDGINVDKLVCEFAIYLEADERDALTEAMQDAIEWLVWDEIWNLMADNAPDGCYWGAHPGDGADFGYWADEADY
jgi:hypothetical protein